jgi:phage shock protein C
MAKSKKLKKSKKDVWLDGICGGIGEYLDIDPVIVRLVFIVCQLYWFYFILMILMPENYE